MRSRRSRRDRHSRSSSGVGSIFSWLGFGVSRKKDRPIKKSDDDFTEVIVPEEVHESVTEKKAPTEKHEEVIEVEASIVDESIAANIKAEEDKEIKEIKETKEPKEAKETEESRKTKETKEPKEPQESKEAKETEESRKTKENKDSKEAEETKNSDLGQNGIEKLKQEQTENLTEEEKRNSESNWNMILALSERLKEQIKEEDEAEAKLRAEAEQKEKSSEEVTEQGVKLKGKPIPPAKIDLATGKPEPVPITETDPALYQNMGNDDFTKKKFRFKAVRTFLQCIIIALTAFVIYMALFTTKVWHPATDIDGVVAGGEDTGFVALSYFGVDRVGNSSDLIGVDQLEGHLKALYRQGYKTITQADIEAYYRDGKPLPKKALFLMFEDGRRDTAIFAQKILEEYNYKATMLTYPEKFDNKDLKFLMPDELIDLENTSFWEMGTNGYRLQYINVFDRYDNYIGEIDPLRYAEIRSCLGRKYNHYLMDYIRDKNYMPKESYQHMEQRISYDYERLRDIYSAELGKVPSLYILMHSNTGTFGNNPNVSKVNEKWIRELFTMNFNREGYCFNQRNSSMYDLTRMQPQPYWPINHLLMRIKYDVNQEMIFEKGTAAKYDTWQLMQGAAEMRDDVYTLTTLPQSFAMAKLKDSQNFSDIRLKVQLQGNAFGTQKVFMRADSDRSRYVSVGIANGKFIVEEKMNGVSKVLYEEKLNIIDGTPVLSIAEDKQKVEIEELKAFARYADSPEMAKEYLARAEKRSQVDEPTVEQGAQAYEDKNSFHSRSFRDVDVVIDNDNITVSLDGKVLLENGKLANVNAGNIYLAAGWNSDAWSQRNLADDVYDGVFKGLEIYNRFQGEETMMYTMAPTGMDLVILKLRELGTKIVDFAVTYF